MGGLAGKLGAVGAEALCGRFGGQGRCSRCRGTRVKRFAVIPNKQWGCAAFFAEKLPGTAVKA